MTLPYQATMELTVQANHYVEPRVIWITDPEPPSGLTYWSRYVLFLRTGFRPVSTHPADWSREALARRPDAIEGIGRVVGFWIRYGWCCAVRFDVDGNPEEATRGIPSLRWLSPKA